MQLQHNAGFSSGVICKKRGQVLKWLNRPSKYYNAHKISSPRYFHGLSIGESLSSLQNKIYGC